MTNLTFYWYDYETFGLSPKTNRISQFGGIRTDESLNIIPGSELKLYCKFTNDCLPSPESCLITGITPDICEQKGLIERDFIKKICKQFTHYNNTCIVGFNSIRFDDEFSRYTLYRNFIDPYAWHWKNNNSRWDIIDVVRMTYALKKDNSLNWVYDDNGMPSFKLDKLAPANDIKHDDAHDALADVYATIGIAKIIKEKQPKLFDYALKQRLKENVKKNIKFFNPILHTSGMYPNKYSCTKLVSPICYHPYYKERVIVFDLNQNPTVLLDLSIEELQLRVFTKKNNLPKEVERIELKEIHFNKSPMFVNNIYKLDRKISTQLQIDMAKSLKNLETLKENKEMIIEKIRGIYKETKFDEVLDVDQMLYDGFLNSKDLDAVNKLDKNAITNLKPNFTDNRLTKLFIHFKARNYPEILTELEQEYWFEVVQARLQEGKDNYMTLDNYFNQIDDLIKKFPNKKKFLQNLITYGEKFL